MKCVVFVYGEGGHAAQMNRLAPKVIKSAKETFKVISMSDVELKPLWSNEHYVTGEARGKYSHMEIFKNNGPLIILKTLSTISKLNKIDTILTTGPGIGVLAALYFKLRGASIIHIETWSRFETKSITGRIMYLIADRFYVQNKSLKALYPKSIYSGVL
ncbi:polysaccharide biosynthesis protein [Vibrio parahaemolyticus]|nr:polysaccharide biosynthesis protein [Vibrio parahaemolyticus]HDM8154685.1 polysaccharide biosynthesis protein [Vibrio harveyi]